MRNPFTRAFPRPAAKPTLRERLAATRERYGRALKIHRALTAPAADPEPQVNRAALVNYATFLALERMALAAEMYPHLGEKAGRFVLSMNAAWRLFYGVADLPRRSQDLPPASSRAVGVLDLVGVDWRSDPPGDGIERRTGGDLFETGDLLRIDAAIEALMRGSECDPEDVPGYQSLDDARSDALVALEVEQAISPVPSRKIGASTVIRHRDLEAFLDAAPFSAATAAARHAASLEPCTPG